MQRYRDQEFFRFLNAIEAEVPPGRAVHVILDNYAAHKSSEGSQVARPQERFTFHFVPTSCSWLNVVEGFLAKLTRRRRKRGLFSVYELQIAINRFVEEINPMPKPFTSDPDWIIADV